TEVLGEYVTLFEGYWLAGMRQKLGLRTEEAGDVELIKSLLGWMHNTRGDFTNTFRDLSEGTVASERYADADFQAGHARWRERLGRDGRAEDAARAAMRVVNPAVIARNHRVEEALAAAEERDDLSAVQELVAALRSPYEPGGDAKYREAPADD